jgi:hypothetical protein
VEPLAIPNRCIWCCSSGPNVAFDESHVLPNCIGNDKQHVLPRGIVCVPCNNYFGSQVEPSLLRDPVFHTIAVFLSVVDPDDMNVFRNKIFDIEHPSTTQINRILNLHSHVQSDQIKVDVKYAISAELSKTYNQTI